MKPSTQLSSAVFYLTPTRTRCDLIIIANDKKEKIASGLLNPFLSHLKTAQDQISKGGYSILLEPKNGSDAVWFTKATFERFVRFVSTPEILEHTMHTLETEILQIEEAIIAQSCKDIGQTIGEDHQEKTMRESEGNKSVHDNEEKAIVLYKPEAPLPEADKSFSQEGNSKVQLLKIMDSRKTVLKKEQGMAFARAVAAGFDIDHVTPLVSFAESFGAMRLLEACSRFIYLWKSKHETGQWLELEASEVLATRSEFSAINSPGIFLSGTTDKHDESNHELPTESNGKSGSTNNADNSAPNGQQEYFEGQFPHLAFPLWPMNNPPGAQPVFPAYPVQGMPYYPTYAGSGPFFQPPHWPMEHASSNFGHQSGHRKQSSDGRDNNTGSEMSDIERTRSLDDMEMSAKFPDSRKQHRKSGGSNKKQSGMVVIRNINYITSKEKKSGNESNSDSDSDSDSDGEYQNSKGDGLEMIHQNSNRSLRNKGRHMNSLDNLSFNNVVSNFGKDADDTLWQAFQNCLLREGDEHASADNKGLLAMENNTKRQANTMGADPLAHGSQDRGAIQDDRIKGTHKIDGHAFPRSRGSDDFIVGSRQNQQKFRNSLGALDVNCFEGATNQMDGESSQGMTDESLIVPFRTMSIDQVGGRDRSAIDMGSEIPPARQILDVRNVVNYEPDGLSLMPERGTEKRSIGYDLTQDYEMQVCAESSQEKGKKEVADPKGGGLQKSDKDKRLEVNSDPLSKQRTGGPIRKGKPSKMSPLEDARARAERLRSYKADLQKMKKEKEEAEMKRIEGLKRERQKRIVSRGSSTTTSAKLSSLSPQIKQLPTKLSPATNKGSKFSDSEPGSSSPLQRLKISTSVGASVPLKASKSSKLNEGGHVAAHRLTRSSSSLSEPKRDSHGVTPDCKASMARIRRLSEPKTITNPPVMLTKARSAESVSKRKLSEGPEKNKISSIINLDRSKAAMLPDLKIKTSKALLNSGENGSTVKGKQKVNGINPSTNAEVKISNRLHQIDMDDNQIVEKTVVMLEYEKPSAPTLHPLEGKLEMGNKHYNDHGTGEKSNVMSNLADAHTPPPVSCVYNHFLPSQHQKQSDSNEVKVSHSYYSKAHVASPKLETRVEGTVRTNVPDVKTDQVDKNSGMSEKTPVKESKGFKRLLKFGKQNHHSLSVDRSVDSECISVDGVEHDDNARNSASSSEVLTLKYLVSQDEISTAGNASQKSSRHFSLLSPFWSKTSEKKQAS